MWNEKGSNQEEVDSRTTADNCCGPPRDNRDCLVDGGIDVLCRRRDALQVASEQ